MFEHFWYFLTIIPSSLFLVGDCQILHISMDVVQKFKSGVSPMFPQWAWWTNSMHDQFMRPATSLICFPDIFADIKADIHGVILPKIHMEARLQVETQKEARGPF